MWKKSGWSDSNTMFTMSIVVDVIPLVLQGRVFVVSCYYQKLKQLIRHFLHILKTNEKDYLEGLLRKEKVSPCYGV